MGKISCCCDSWRDAFRREDELKLSTKRIAPKRAPAHGSPCRFLREHAIKMQQEDRAFHRMLKAEARALEDR